jgi:hypothetical protein
MGIKDRARKKGESYRGMGEEGRWHGMSEPCSGVGWEGRRAWG